MRHMAVTSRYLLALGMALALGLAAATPVAGAPQDEYLLGADDVLQITIWGPQGLSDRFAIGADNTVAFPMIGHVPAAGLTVRQLEAELVKRLADGYYNNPEVTVSVIEYRSQNVYVLGEVRTPGIYSLRGSVSVTEMLARAGSTSADAGDRVTVRRRARGSAADGPALADADADEVIDLSIHGLSSGEGASDLLLHDGDTVVVSSAPTIFVFGNVMRPGEYRVQRNTTVLQALSLAGGITARGSTHRLKVVRAVDGESRELDIQLDDLVQAGDTIKVGERFF